MAMPTWLAAQTRPPETEAAEGGTLVTLAPFPIVRDPYNLRQKKKYEVRADETRPRSNASFFSHSHKFGYFVVSS